MHVVYNCRDARTFFGVFVQDQSASNTIPNKFKKKAKVVEEESDLEIMPRVEINYENTKSVTGAELELKWGNIYHMLQD